MDIATDYYLSFTRHIQFYPRVATSLRELRIQSESYHKKPADVHNIRHAEFNITLSGRDEHYWPSLAWKSFFHVSGNALKKGDYFQRSWHQRGCEFLETVAIRFTACNATKDIVEMMAFYLPARTRVKAIECPGRNNMMEIWENFRNPKGWTQHAYHSYWKSRCHCQNRLMDDEKDSEMRRWAEKQAYEQRQAQDPKWLREQEVKRCQDTQEKIVGEMAVHEMALTQPQENCRAPNRDSPRSAFRHSSKV